MTTAIYYIIDKYATHIITAAELEDRAELPYPSDQVEEMTPGCAVWSRGDARFCAWPQDRVGIVRLAVCFGGYSIWGNLMEGMDQPMGQDLLETIHDEYVSLQTGLWFKPCGNCGIEYEAGDCGEAEHYAEWIDDKGRRVAGESEIKVCTPCLEASSTNGPGLRKVKQ